MLSRYPEASKAPEFQEVQKQLSWFKINYPNIERVKTSAVPMISGTGDRTPDGRQRDLYFRFRSLIRMETWQAVCAAVILSSTLRGITDSENYSLISPLAEYISVPLPRDKNLRLMMRAANSVPAANNHIFGNGGCGYP